MMVQHLKRRPLSRYLKDFKHSQTHCAHCRKLLDRITLVRVIFSILSALSNFFLSKLK